MEPESEPKLERQGKQSIDLNYKIMIEISRKVCFKMSKSKNICFLIYAEF